MRGGGGWLDLGVAGGCPSVVRRSLICSGAQIVYVCLRKCVCMCRCVCVCVGVCVCVCVCVCMCV